MQIKISEEILKRFKGYQMGVILCFDIDNKEPNKEIDKMLKEVGNYIKMTFVPEDVSKHDLISPWRVVFKEFGSKPSSYHSSVEALVKRIMKGEAVPKVNKLVDIYNLMSLKHLVPMGADDLDKVDGNIQLCLANGDEKFTAIGSSEVENPDKGEAIYKDDKSVLCRRWNWGDCDKTKLTEETLNAVIYVDGLPPLSKEKFMGALRETTSLIRTFCDGKVEFHVLDKNKPKLDFVFEKNILKV